MLVDHPDSQTFSSWIPDSDAARTQSSECKMTKINMMHEMHNYKRHETTTTFV
jgi:hypothetical protein